MMSSSSPGIKEDILIEAIRAVKSQRQRPGVDRIFRWLRLHKNIRRFDNSLVFTALEGAVSRGSIRKIIKDGRETYAEWKKSVRGKRSTGGKISIASAICQCIQQQGTSEGLALEKICDHMMKMTTFKDMDRLVLKYHIRLHCEKAVKRGKLLKDGRCYRLARTGQVRWNAEGKECDSDISFLVDKAVTNKRPATPIEICSFCFGSQQKNRNGEPEELLYCVECGRSGHPSCLKFSSSLTDKVRKLRWQCIECKRCSVCSESSREHLMLFCDSCDRGYHMDCCQPPIQKRPRGVWICCICAYEVDQRKSFHFVDDRLTGTGRKFANGYSGKHKFNKRRAELMDMSDSEMNDAFCGCQPFAVSQTDEDWFKTAQKLTHEKLLSGPADGALMTSDASSNHPRLIEIGKYEVTTWYSSPYPHIFAKLPKLYICEFCLRYVESRTILKNHLAKCFLLRPPGDEIYRDGNLSIFEVDGTTSKVYCQDLCLLAKLFLDHKTLYYDVEPFVFYVLTINDKLGCHLVGYFSKEKYCVQNYNLSCIMVLPQYQRHGYGRLLIDFSYLLSRMEGHTGTPEKPLSELGQLTYEAYWKDVVGAYLQGHLGQSLSLKDIGTATGICTQDVLNTLLSLQALHAVGNSYKIVFDGSMTSDMKSVKKSTLVLDPERLCWTPFAFRSSTPADESEAFQESKDLSSNEISELKKSVRSVDCSTPLVPSCMKWRQNADGFGVSPIVHQRGSEAVAMDTGIEISQFNGRVNSVRKRPGRKKRGWVKGRKRISRPEDSLGAEKTTFVNEDDICQKNIDICRNLTSASLSATDIPQNDTLSSSLHDSSVAQTQSQMQSPELQTSDLNEQCKAFADVKREMILAEDMTEIYDVSRNDAVGSFSSPQNSNTTLAYVVSPRYFKPNCCEETKNNIIRLPAEEKLSVEVGGRSDGESFPSPDGSDVEKIRAVEANNDSIRLSSFSFLDADVRISASDVCNRSDTLSHSDASSMSTYCCVSTKHSDVGPIENHDDEEKVAVELSADSCIGSIINDEVDRPVNGVREDEIDSSIVSEVVTNPTDESFDVNDRARFTDSFAGDSRYKSNVTYAGTEENDCDKSFVVESSPDYKRILVSPVDADCAIRSVEEGILNVKGTKILMDCCNGIDSSESKKEDAARICHTEIVFSVGDDFRVGQSSNESVTIVLPLTFGLFRTSSSADTCDSDSADDSGSDGTIALNIDDVEEGISCDYFSDVISFTRDEELSSCANSRLQNVLIPVCSTKDVDSEDGKITCNGNFCLEEYRRLENNVSNKNGFSKPSPSGDRNGKLLIEASGLVGAKFLAEEPIDRFLVLESKASNGGLKTENSDSCKINDSTTSVVEQTALLRSLLPTSEKIKPFQLSNCAYKFC